MKRKILWARAAWVLPFLVSLSLFQNCSGFNPSPSLTNLASKSADSGENGPQGNQPPPVDEPMNEQQVNGKALYAQHCALCHMNLDVSNIKGSVDNQIFTAISMVPQMVAIPGVASLTVPEVQAIAAALAMPATPPANNPSPPTQNPNTPPAPPPVVSQPPPSQCTPSIVRGLAKQGVRRLSGLELRATLQAVWPNFGPLEGMFRQFPEPDRMEDVEQFDPLFSKA